MYVMVCLNLQIPREYHVSLLISSLIGEAGKHIPSMPSNSLHLQTQPDEFDIKRHWYGVLSGNKHYIAGVEIRGGPIAHANERGLALRPWHLNIGQP